MAAPPRATDPIRYHAAPRPVRWPAWAAVAAATLLWLASAATLVRAVARGSVAGDAILGAIAQMVLTTFTAPALWAWWRHLLTRHVDAHTPRPPDEPRGPHLSLGGGVRPPTRW